MFRTDAQLIRLRNRHPVAQPASGYPTGYPVAQPGSPIRNPAGNAIRLRNGTAPLRNRVALELHNRIAMELSGCTTG